MTNALFTGLGRPAVILALALGVVVTGVLVTWSLVRDNDRVPREEPKAQASWPLPGDVLAAVTDAGLSLGPMGTADHYHPRLSIRIEGQQIGVPAGIGVEPDTGAMSAVHTHTPDGVVHVEAEEVGQRFTLGQLFQQWGVQLSEDQLGPSEVSNVTATVNGVRYNGDPASIVLAPKQRIEIQAR